MKSKITCVHWTVDLDSTVDFYPFCGSYFNRYPHHRLQFLIFGILQRWIHLILGRLKHNHVKCLAQLHLKCQCSHQAVLEPPFCTVIVLPVTL